MDRNSDRNFNLYGKDQVMNGEMDVFTELGAPAYKPYDPFSGWTPSMIAGGPAKNFPIEAFEPEPDWLTRLAQPVDYLWETGEQFVEQTTEKLPELLWGYGLSKLRKVNEGAGVTVIHSQAPQAGGTPAQPTTKVIPGQVPFGAPPQAVGTGTMILIGAGLIVLYILLR